MNYPRRGHQGVSLMPRGVYPRRSVEERFWEKVDPCRTDGCALWLGARTPGGYGSISIKGRMIPAHHILAGPPPLGLVYDHVVKRGCTHRNCVWPEHLEAVTGNENIKRGRAGQYNASKTHCPHGHEFTPANTYIRPGRYGRVCRECRRASLGIDATAPAMASETP